MYPRLSRLTLVLVFSATAFATEAPDPATKALAGVRAYRQAHAHQHQLPSSFLACLPQAGCSRNDRGEYCSTC